MSFVHLHVHSCYSLLESPLRLDRLVEQCHVLGQETCAVTDTASLAGAVRWYRIASTAGIRPLVGTELPIGETDQDYIVLLAKSLEGYSNLCRLVSAAQLRGREHPWVSMENIQDHRSGVLALYGSPESLCYQALARNDERQALRLLDPYVQLFGTELALDVQNPLHRESGRVLRRMERLCRSAGILPCATNGVTHLRRADAEAREILLSIKAIEQLDERARHISTNAEQYLKSEEEMLEAFDGWPEPVRCASELAERCAFSFPEGTSRTPSSHLTSGTSLREVVEAGAVERYGSLSEAVQDRIDSEMQLITSLHLSEYFLMVRDIVLLAKKRGIAFAGRGSGANSIVCYCIGATQVDPIANHLLFERFLNGGRHELPDVDIDFDAVRRDELVDDVFAAFGEDRVCRIANVNTYNIRGAFRDVGKALGFSEEEVSEATQLLPWYTHRHIREVIRDLPELRAFPYETITNWVRLADAVMGLPRTLSTHLAGLVIAPFPLTDLVPLQRSGTGSVITQYDKDDVEWLGLVKMDLLGLRTLTAAVDATDQIARDTGAPFSLEKIPADDPATYQMLRSGATIGVFQLESPGMRNLLLKLQPRCFSDIIANISLFRPGPVKLHMDRLFLERRDGTVPVTCHHPCLEPILRETYGVIIFQEQVLEVAHAIAGLSYAESDVLRRQMTEDTPEGEIREFERRFAEGALQNGVSAEVAADVFTELRGFASYGFNKGHAASFGMLSYRTAYLKTHFPAYYLAGLMNAMPVGFYPPKLILDEARRVGVAVLPPDINASAEKTVAHAREMRLGFDCFSALARRDLRRMLEERSEQGPFRSVQEFRDRTHINRRGFRALVLGGAFDTCTSRESACVDAGMDEEARMFRERSAACGARIATLAGEIDGIGYPVSGSITEFLPLFAVPSSARVTLAEQKAPLITSAQAHGMTDGTMVWVKGFLLRLNTPPTKSGKRIFFATLVDEQGLMECIMFPDVQRTQTVTLKRNNLLAFYGELDNAGKGNPYLTIHKAVPLEQASAVI